MNIRKTLIDEQDLKLPIDWQRFRQNHPFVVKAEGCPDRYFTNEKLAKITADKVHGEVVCDQPVLLEHPAVK